MFEEKRKTDFTKNMWLLQNGARTIQCKQCMAKHRKVGWWTCFASHCKTQLPKDAFTLAHMKHTPQQLMKAKYRLCDRCISWRMAIEELQVGHHLCFEASTLRESANWDSKEQCCLTFLCLALHGALIEDLTVNDKHQIILWTMFLAVLALKNASTLDDLHCWQCIAGMYDTKTKGTPKENKHEQK